MESRALSRSFGVEKTAKELAYIRAFVAIELPDNAKHLLAQWQDLLRIGGGNHVKWVDVSSVHLTLKFLGNMEADLLSRVREEVEEVAQSNACLRLALNGLGVFPSIEHPRVLWAGLEGELNVLLGLQKDLDKKLAGLGFPVENRPFVPHLTLGRVRETAPLEERRRLGQLVVGMVVQRGEDIQVASISLMKSDLTRSGAVYTSLAIMSLQGIV